MGPAALPWNVAHASVNDRAVVPALQQWELPAQEIHAFFPSPRLVPSKVTGLIAWLQRHFADQWWRRAH